MAKILVTGALGAVGMPVTKELKAGGHDVWTSDIRHSGNDRYWRCDVADFRQLSRVFEEQSFDYVYHAAAEFGRHNGEDYYEQLWISNAIGTKNMLRMQERYGFRMIFFSSSEIYGDYPDIMHEDVPDKVPIRQLNDYAISKWVNEMQIRNSAERYETETVRVRLFNTFGSGEYYSRYRSVICQFIYNALHERPYTVYLRHKRSHLYIDDCVRTLSRIVENFKSGEVYNIGSDQVYDIKTTSHVILKHLGKSDDLVEYREIEEHNTLEKRPDITKAVTDLGHETTVDLDEGVARTVAWQKQVYGIA